MYNALELAKYIKCRHLVQSEEYLQYILYRLQYTFLQDNRLAFPEEIRAGALFPYVPSVRNWHLYDPTWKFDLWNDGKKSCPTPEDAELIASVARTINAMNIVSFLANAWNSTSAYAYFARNPGGRIGQIIPLDMIRIMG